MTLMHPSKSMLRIAPPLTIRKGELDKGIDIIDEAIGERHEGPRSR